MATITGLLASGAPPTLSVAVTIGLSPNVAPDGGDDQRDGGGRLRRAAEAVVRAEVVVERDQAVAVRRLDDVAQVDRRRGRAGPSTAANPRPRRPPEAARRTARGRPAPTAGAGAVAGVHDPHLVDRRGRVADHARGEGDAAAVGLRVDEDDRRRVGQRRLAQVAAVEQAKVEIRERAARAGSQRDVGRAMLRRRDQQAGRAVAAQRTEVVHRPRSHRVEHRRHERDVDAAQFGRRRAGQRRDHVVGVVAATETDAAQHQVAHRRRHVDRGQRQRRLGRVRDHALRPFPPIRGDLRRRLRRLDALENKALGRQRRRHGQFGGHQPERRQRRRRVARPGRRDGRDRAPRHRAAVAAARHVHRQHRQAEQRRLEQRLLVDAADVGRGRQVVELGLDQRLADRNRARTGAQLPREVGVQPLAVFEEVGVAVLVAGAGDQRRLLLREGLRPVELERHAFDRVGVDEVVARVAAGAEHDRVGEAGRRRGEIGRDQAGREVGGQRAVGAEVAGQEDHVVTAAEQLAREVIGRPRQWVVGFRVRALRRNAVGRDQRVDRARRFRRRARS